MASPQTENGYTKLANELLEAICCYPLGGSELRTFLFVIRKTYGFRKKQDRISLTQLQLGTGLSRPTTVKSLRELVNRGLLVKVKSGVYSVQKDWEKWVVNPSLLVKLGGSTGKYAFTEIGKPVLTHKRKKENIQKKEILIKLRKELSIKGILR